MDRYSIGMERIRRKGIIINSIMLILMVLIAIVIVFALNNSDYFPVYFGTNTKLGIMAFGIAIFYMPLLVLIRTDAGD